MLKMRGHTILNWMDLKKYFDPWQAYRQLEEFCSFAEVHCVPLPFLIPSPEGGYERAEYLTKEMWRQLWEEDIEVESEASWEQYEEVLMRQMELTSGEDFGIGQRKCLEQDTEENASAVRCELENAEVPSKIRSIQEALRQEGIVSGRLTLMFLAICMIAEVDPDKINFARKDKTLPQKREEMQGSISSLADTPVVLGGEQWRRQLEGVPIPREFAVDEAGECLILHSSQKEECKIYNICQEHP